MITYGEFVKWAAVAGFTPTTGLSGRVDAASAAAAQALSAANAVSGQADQASANAANALSAVSAASALAAQALSAANSVTTIANNASAAAAAASAAAAAASAAATNAFSAASAATVLARSASADASQALSKINVLSISLVDALSKITALTTNVNAVSQSVTDALSKITVVTTNLGTLSVSVSAMQTVITALSATVTDNTSKITALTTNVNAVSQSVTDALSKITVIQTNLGTLSVSVSALASVVAAISATVTNNTSAISAVSVVAANAASAAASVVTTANNASAAAANALSAVGVLSATVASLGGTWPTNEAPAQMRAGGGNNKTYDAWGIVSATGVYAQYPTGMRVLQTCNIPSWTLSGATAAQTKPLTVINLPNQYIGPNAEIDVEIRWTVNSGATTKALQINWNAVANIISVDSTATTTIDNITSFRILNRGVLNQQWVVANGLANATLQSFSVDVNESFTSISIFGIPGSTTDSICVQGYRAVAYNPPVHQTAQVRQGTRKLFYGGNSHYDEINTRSVGTYMAFLSQLGATVLRINYNQASEANVKIFASAVAAVPAYTMVLLIDVAMYSSTTGAGGINFWGSEGAAYNYAFSFATIAVSSCYALGVRMFEAGNELDTKNGINTVGDSGGQLSSFSMAIWPSFRGIQRGAIDGIHAFASDTIALSNAFTVCGIGASDGLWDGVNPDGTTSIGGVTNSTCRWDVTNWHNYRDYLSMYSMQKSFNKPYLNVIEYISRRYQRPIWIGEWNGTATDGDTTRVAWMNRVMYEWYSTRKKYNIMGICVYQLINGSPWGMFLGSASGVGAMMTTGSAYKAFIAANPDV